MNKDKVTVFGNVYLEKINDKDSKSFHINQEFDNRILAEKFIVEASKQYGNTLIIIDPKDLKDLK